MIQLIQKMKKNQKGFTLVELIVVLVILAILAAFTIPVMLGFVNDAKGKAYIAEAREVYMAYQGATSEFASGAESVDGDYTETAAPAGATAGSKVQKSAMAKLVGDLVTSSTTTDDPPVTTYTVQKETKWTVTVANKKVKTVVFIKGGYRVTIEYNASGGSGEAQIEKL
ncbi:MAG: type II secretion system protein [Eubacterium sp.]